MNWPRLLFIIAVRMQNWNAPEGGNKAVFITGMLQLSCWHLFFHFGPVMENVHRIPADKPKKEGSYQYSCVICSAINIYWLGSFQLPSKKVTIMAKTACLLEYSAQIIVWEKLFFKLSYFSSHRRRHCWTYSSEHKNRFVVLSDLFSWVSEPLNCLHSSFELT